MAKASSKPRPSPTFKRGDHVSWNSEAGRVSGIIQKKITSPIVFKGYTRHASAREPQYIIQSDKTDHVAIHKGSALSRLSRTSPAPRARKGKRPKGARSRKSG